MMNHFDQINPPNMASKTVSVEARKVVDREETSNLSDASFPPQKKTNASSTVGNGRKTLVVPAVAIGNVGQIAVDLLCRLVKEPIQVLDSRGLLMPCAGNVGNSQNRRLTTPLELHTLNDEVAFLHINSMVVPGRSRDFAQYVIQIAQQFGFDRILVVGGASALALINDDQLSRTRHVPRIFGKESSVDAGFLPLEYEVSELKLAGLLPFLVQESRKAEGVDILAIVSFVFEGENWMDGVEMAKATMKVLGLNVPQEQ